MSVSMISLVTPAVLVMHISAMLARNIQFIVLTISNNSSTSTIIYVLFVPIVLVLIIKNSYSLELRYLCLTVIHINTTAFINFIKSSLPTLLETIMIGMIKNHSRLN